MNKFILIKIIKILIISNAVFLFWTVDTFACELWVRNFAKEYCTNKRHNYNPLGTFKKLKNKYNIEFKKKELSSNESNVNKILVENILETCKEKKHYILRAFH